MKRKFALLLVAVLLPIFLMVGCGQSKAASVELKLAGIKTEDDPATAAMNKFAELCAADEDLNITIKTFPNSTLGSTNDMLSGMPTGLTDMFYNTLSCYPFLDGAKSFNAVAAPFIWGSHDEMEAFLASDIAQKWFDDAAASTGVRVLAACGELPPRQLTSNVPVANADDFAGLKIRTAESALVQQTMKKLGATPVVVPFADLYMGLRQGTVDAQENNFITVKNSSLYEVQKYFMKTDYIRDVGAIFISEKVWQGLTAEQQTALKAYAEEAVKYEASQISEQMDSVMTFLNENMTYVDIDVASIQAKLGEDIYREFDDAGELWPTGTLDDILVFKESYSK